MGNSVERLKDGTGPGPRAVPRPPVAQGPASSGDGAGQSTKARSLSFPRDEGAHPWATNEWWYFSSHLRSSEGRDFGFHFNFTRGGLVVMLADLSAQTMLCRTVERGRRLESSGTRLDLEFGESRWRTGPRPGTYEATVGCEGAKAVLRMTSKKPRMLVDGRGWVKEGLLGRSWYYAQTRLAVEGSLEVEGREVSVAGSGWVDRQWGSWDWTGLGPWDWFGLQLEDGRDLLGFAVKHPLADGVVSGSLNLCGTEGGAARVAPFRVERLASWRSPRTGAEYGVQWAVLSPGRAALRVEALLQDQELMAGFWEGACTVAGELDGRRVHGRGYFEQADPVVPIGRPRWLVYMQVGAMNHLARRAFGRAAPNVWGHLPVGGGRTR